MIIILLVFSFFIILFNLFWWITTKAIYSKHLPKSLCIFIRCYFNQIKLVLFVLMYLSCIWLVGMLGAYYSKDIKVVAIPFLVLGPLPFAYVIRKLDHKLSDKTIYDIRDNHFILYLRGFREDNYESQIDIENNCYDFSELSLTKVINRAYPLYAIGRPKESYQPFGADRIYFDDDEWKNGLNELLDRCKAVIILITDTENCIYEINQCVNYAFKTYCIVYNTETYMSIKEKLPNVLPQPLMDENGQIIPFIFCLDKSNRKVEQFTNSTIGCETILDRFWEDLKLPGGHPVSESSFETGAFIEQHWKLISFVTIMLAALVDLAYQNNLN